MNNSLLFCCLQVSHFVPSPCCVVDIFKAQTSIETLCSWIAFVYEQSDRLSLPLLIDELFQQQRSESLMTVAFVDSKRVDIVLSGLRLVGHATEVLSQELLGCLQESFAQSMQISAIVAYDDTGYHRMTVGCVVIECYHRVAIAVLAVVSSDQCCHHAMEVL